MAIWALVPFLDRRAARNQAGPAFTDFGVGILYFLGYLMLKAWDIGAPHVAHGVDPTGTVEAARLVARTTAMWLLGGAAAVTLMRALLWRHRYFWISALPVLLQAVLHGFFGVNYLVAGAVSLGLLVVVLGTTWNRTRAAAVAATVAVLVLCGASGARAADAPGASGSLPPASWPADFQALLNTEADGHKVVSEVAQRHFKELPSYAQEEFFAALKKGMLANAEQLNTLLELEISDENVELLVADNCVLCHTNPDYQSEETLFKKRQPGDPNAHLDIRNVVNDVHLRRGLSCSGCHGGKPTDEDMSDEIAKRWPKREVRIVDRTWIPRFCTEACH